MKAIELEKAYNPKDFEDRIYKDWESKGCFKPASDQASPVHAEWECKCADCKDGKKKPALYSVVIPPPNVTGVLHMGHGLNNTLQDIVVPRAERQTEEEPEPTTPESRRRTSWSASLKKKERRATTLDAKPFWSALGK